MSHSPGGGMTAPGTIEWTPKRKYLFGDNVFHRKVFLQFFIPVFLGISLWGKSKYIKCFHFSFLFCLCVFGVYVNSNQLKRIWKIVTCNKNVVNILLCSDSKATIFFRGHIFSWMFVCLEDVNSFYTILEFGFLLQNIYLGQIFCFCIAVLRTVFNPPSPF